MRDYYKATLTMSDKHKSYCYECKRETTDGYFIGVPEQPHHLLALFCVDCGEKRIEKYRENDPTILKSEE